MQQIFLLLLISCLGWVTTASVLLNERYRFLSTPISLFVGTAIYTFILFGLLNLQSFTLWSIDVSFILVNALTMLLIVILIWRNKQVFKLIRQNDIIYFTGFLISIITLGYIFSKYNYSFATADSHFYLHMGEGFALIGFKADSIFINTYDLTGLASFYSIYHSLARVLNIDYLWLLGPTYGAIFIVSFFMVLKEILKDALLTNLQASILALLSIIIILSSRFFIINAYYLNNHIFTSVHFTLFFLVGLVSLNNKSENLALISIFLLLPTVFMRMENGVIILIFSLIFASQTSTSGIAKKILVLSGLTVLFYSICYIVAIPQNEATMFINNSKMLLSAFCGFCFILFGVGISSWNLFTINWIKYKMYLPYIIILMSTFIVSYSFVFKSDYTTLSVLFILNNMFDIQTWNHFWYLLSFIFVFSLIMPRGSHYKNHDFIVMGITFYFLYTIELSYLRGSPYREGFGDSGNRMLIHIVPLIVAHFTIYFSNYIRKMKKS